MRRLVFSFILIIFLVALCSASIVPVKNVKILTSFYPIYIMTLNITKNIQGITLQNMAKPITGCLHDYQLTPGDMFSLSEAKAFIINGGGMESFMQKVIKQMPNLKIIDSSKGIPLIREGNEINPHVFVSISGAILQVKNIADSLSKLFPDNAAKLLKNSSDYIKKLEILKIKMYSSLKNVRNRNIVTFHEAFPYFAKEFNLNIAAVIEREPGSEPTAADLTKTIQIIKKVKIKALFAEPQYPERAARIIAQETGATLYILDPAVTGSIEADAYINIMEKNLKVLIKALNS